MNRFLFFLVLLFACNVANTEEKVNSIEQDSSMLVGVPVVPVSTGISMDTVFFVDALIDSVEKELDNSIIDRKYLLLGDNYDTMWISLYRNENVPLKIVYTLFEDGGKAFGFSEFYFVDSGKYVLQKTGYDDMELITVLFSGEAYRMRKRKSSDFIELLKDSIDVRKYIQLEASKLLKELLQGFPGISYNSVNSDNETSIPLSVYRDIDIYSSPDTNSSIIGHLSAGSQISYLDASSRAYTFGGRKWIWYFISSEKGKGWVFGHSDFIGETTDESY